MFESNFPVDKRAVSYAVLWNVFKRLAVGASPSEKVALFREQPAASIACLYRPNLSSPHGGELLDGAARREAGRERTEPPPSVT